MLSRRPWTLYRRYVVVGFLGFVAAALIGLVSLATPLLEIFPFYSWILFPVEPNGKGYQVYLERVGGKTFDPPCPLNQAGDDVRHGKARSVVLFRIVQRLGKACEAGDEEEIARQRTYLEEALEHGTVYRIDVLDADPLVLWKTKHPAKEASLRTFLFP